MGIFGDIYEMSPDWFQDLSSGLIDSIASVPMPFQRAMSNAVDWATDNPRHAMIMAAATAAAPGAGLWVSHGIHKDREAGKSDRVIAGNALQRMGTASIVVGTFTANPALLALGPALITTGHGVKAGQMSSGDAARAAGQYKKAVEADPQGQGELEARLREYADDPDDLDAAMQLYAEAAQARRAADRRTQAAHGAYTFGGAQNTTREGRGRPRPTTQTQPRRGGYTF